MEVGILEARDRFPELIEAAERGEEVVVTREGKPVVRLSAVQDADERAARVAEFLARADEFREGVAERIGRAFTHDELISARDEGRR